MKVFSRDQLAGKKILIVLLGAIGDVVRGTSLATRIKQSVPTAHVTWAVEPKSYEVLVQNPAVDDIVRFERGGGLAAYRKFLKELRERKFDVVIDLQRHLKSGFTAFATRAPIRVGFHRKDSKEGNWLFQTHTIPAAVGVVPKIDQYHAFGDLFQLPRMDPYQFSLGLTDDVRRSAEKVFAEQCAKQGLTNIPGPANRAALIIGASWESKIWPVDRFAELTRALWNEFGIVSLLVGGPGERKLAAQIRKSLVGVPLCDLTGATTLRELGVVFQRVRVAIGSDSGPMHLAAAVGCPVISVWGPTSPVRTGPYGSTDLILQSSIGCSPCYLRNCPGLEKLCLSDIPSAAVVSRLRRLLEGSAGSA